MKLLAVALIGFFAGELINYIANVLLKADMASSGPFLSTGCQHKISLTDRQNKCRHCRNRLLFEYLVVGILTAGVFCILYWRFGFTVHVTAMMILVAALIAVCITDFKAKIIPHEITYPAILLGIVYSAEFRSDFIGALAGIGLSYIIFDFLAFYGLQIYLWMNKPTGIPQIQFISKHAEAMNSSTARSVVSSCGIDVLNKMTLRGTKKSLWLSNTVTEAKRSTGKFMQYWSSGLFCKGVPVEELEVIGGGDAVLSALISAWLGWQKLVLALLLGFLFGAALGAMYLLIELRKQRLMSLIVRPVIVSSVVSCSFAILGLILLATCMQQPISHMPYPYVLPLAAVAGCLFGIIIVGSRLSKPFPFGPALAAGAIVAIFS